jgi:hypothetical protein
MLKDAEVVGQFTRAMSDRRTATPVDLRPHLRPYGKHAADASYTQPATPRQQSAIVVRKG